MSTPLDVLPNSTILSRISQELPALFSIDPLSQNAISFARVHPQTISIVSIAKPLNNTIVVEHKTTAYFKKFAFGSSVFLSGIPYALTDANSNPLKELNAIWDINEYSTAGFFSLSSPDLATVILGATFTAYIEITVGATVVSGLTVTGISTGRLAVGQVITGTGVTSGTRISAYGTGSGGLGTYYLDIMQTAPSTAMTASLASGYINIAKITRNQLPNTVLSFSSVISNPAYSLFSEESSEDPSLYVADAVMSLSSSCSYFSPEYMSLADYSLKTLVEYFQKKYDAKIETGYGGIKTTYSDDLKYGTHIPASLLVEGGLDIDANAISWPIFTNNNFKFLMPLVLMIKDYKAQLDAAKQQTNQHMATGEWLEYWGKILNVPRQTSEINLDEMYRSRMQREALLPKSNNVAIAELVSSATGQTTSVVDGSPPFQLIDPLIDKDLKISPFNRTTSFLPYTKTSIISPWVGIPTSITIGSVTNSSPYWNASITISGVTLMSNGSPYYFPASSWSAATVYGTDLTGSLGSGVVTITGTPSTTIINIRSTAVITSGTLGSLGISYSAATYNISTSSTTFYYSDSASGVTSIGPITGSGTFIVKVTPDDTINNILSPNLQNFVYTLVNRYKPAGVSFTVESLLT